MILMIDYDNDTGNDSSHRWSCFEQVELLSLNELDIEVSCIITTAMAATHDDSSSASTPDYDYDAYSEDPPL